METTYHGYTIKFNEKEEIFFCNIGGTGEDENIITAEKISTIKNKIDKIDEAPKQKPQECIELMGYSTEIEVSEIKVGSFGFDRWNGDRPSAWVTHKEGRTTSREKYTPYSLDRVYTLPTDPEALKTVRESMEKISLKRKEFEVIAKKYEQELSDLKSEIILNCEKVRPTVDKENLPYWG